MFKTVTAEELKELIDANEPLCLIDVRDPWEFELCRIEGSRNIPLETLPVRIAELDPERPTVLICHHGMRSQQAAQHLDSRGFAHTMNLEGGVDEWAQSIDPDMEQY